MRLLIAVLAFATLAACTPPEPITAGGVGFESYPDYRARREAELASGDRLTFGGPGPVTTYTRPMAGAPIGMAGGGPITSGPITSGPIGATSPVTTAATIQPLPQTTAALPTTAPSEAGISDEQDFSAVSSRETIQSDKERIAQNRAQYVQIPPTALPQRQGGGGSPIIEYAINAPNRLGQSIYSRSGLSLSNSERACGRYASPAEAQEAFLRSGGPRRDPKNLDPDGDGFACAWDPTPFQKVRG